MDAKLTLHSESSNDSLDFLTRGNGETVSIKDYFQSILNLTNSGEEFPVDLDDVWPLVYNRKDVAVRALNNKDYFTEGIDYQFFRQNAENSGAGRPTGRYRLSVRCLEFLIARRVPAVFEVYRKVFHRTFSEPIQVKLGPTSYVEDINAKLLTVKMMSEILNLDQVSKIRALNPILKEVGLSEIEYSKNERASKSATDLLNDKGIKMQTSDFNKRLEEAGIIEKIWRTSTKNPNKKKYFWSVKSKYSKYGHNMKHVKSHNDTQPYWYIDTFDELLSKLGMSAK